MLTIARADVGGGIRKGRHQRGAGWCAIHAFWVPIYLKSRTVNGTIAIGDLVRPEALYRTVRFGGLHATCAYL